MYFEGAGSLHLDLKAVNPNAKAEEDARTPQELVDLIEAKGHEVTAALASLRGLIAPQ